MKTSIRNIVLAATGFTALYIYTAAITPSHPPAVSQPIETVNTSALTPVNDIAPATSSEPTTSRDASLDYSYGNQIHQEADDIDVSLEKFVALMQTPRVGDDDWTLHMAAQLATWQITYKSAQALQPPPEWRAWNGRYVAMLSRLNRAANEVAHGMDDRDATELDKATEDIQAVNTEITTLTDEFAKIQGQKINQGGYPSE